MTVALVSFIGRGRRSDNAGRTGYEQATYRFPSGREYVTSFFGWALWQELQGNDAPPERWIVIGTAGSTWSAMADGLDDTAYEQALEALEDTDAKTIEKAVTERELAILAPPLQAGLGVPDLRLELIDHLMDAQEQRHFMGVFLRNLEAGDEVILDITHAFRHMPAVAAFMVMALQPLRGIRVCGLHYGALDMRDESGTAPVIDLGLCAEYSDLAAVTAEYCSTGHYRRFGRHFPELAEALDQTCFLENTNNISQARAHACKLQEQLKTQVEQKKDPMLGETAARVAEALDYATGKSLYGRMLSKAQFFYSRKEYIKAAVLGYEAMLRAASLQQDPGRTDQRYDEDARGHARDALRRALGVEDRKTFGCFGALRNCLAHGTPATGKDVQRALQSRAACEALLGECLALAGRICAGEVTLQRT